MKFILLVVTSLITVSSSAVPIISSGGQSLRCRFIVAHHSALLRNIYTCEVSGRFRFLNSDDEISSVSGDHMPNKTNDDVEAFKADAAWIEYFPRGLSNYFKNLVSILINLSRLRELKQSDLKPYRKLKHLDLFENRIEYLERDLFKYNEDLEVVWFSSNRIKVIHETAFDGPKALKKLYMGGNICIRESANTDEGVQNLITKIKRVCRVPPDNLPDELTTTQPDDTTTELFPASFNQTQILNRQLIMMEDEVYDLKEKRENLLIRMVTIEEENLKLKNSQNDTQKRVNELQRTIDILNDKTKKGDKEGVVYIREAFQLRNELKTQLDNMNSIVLGYKQQVNALNSSFMAANREKNEFKVESLKRLRNSFEFRDKFENLQAAKASRDLITIVIILILLTAIVVMIAPSAYARFAKKPAKNFNSFENAMRIKMMDVEGGENLGNLSA